jgi:multicomponent Na+:H+ antiporter subunit D
MLAYSTFGQIGFILVGIGWGTSLALVGAIVYAFNHAFIKSSLLMLTGIVSSHTKTKTAALVDIAGAGKPLLFAGFLYFLGGLALAGIPPMNGFISKLALVQGGISAQEWISLGLVVVAGAITLLYMTRTWSLMFQRKPDETTVALKNPGDGDSVLAPALLILICVVLGVYAAPLVDLAQVTVDQIANTSIYINAVLGG